MATDTVSINVRLTPENNRIVGVFKEYMGLSSKEEAINKLIENSSEDILERPFKEEFLRETKEIFEKMKNKKPTTIVELRKKYLSD
jgi:hypothetical protein